MGVKQGTSRNNTEKLTMPSTTTKKRIRLIAGLALTAQVCVLTLSAQQVVPLYPGEIPNSIPHSVKEVVEERNGQFSGYRGATHPTLEIVLPKNADKPAAAVVICPGGGYVRQVYRREGTEIAEAFAEQGVAAFILKYRIPNDATMADKSLGALQDAQQAIRLVRQNASKWNVDPKRVGIMGFSAGGHVASTAATHFKKSSIPNPEGTSLRPDFTILIYPVVSMLEGFTHAGSRKNLLGDHPNDAQVRLFSNELQVDKDTPPTWLTHAGDDKAVPVANSVRFYNALIENNVPAEMHLYPAGGHGFVLKRPAKEWMASIFDWMERGNLKTPPR
jgi:acetyl esterase/lipase